MKPSKFNFTQELGSFLKLTLTLHCLIILSFYSYSQKKELTISIKEGENILKILNLNQNGFLLLTGKKEGTIGYSDSQRILRKFNPEMNLEWEHNLSEESNLLSNPEEFHLVASPSGNNFFLIDYVAGKMMKNLKPRITRFNSDGSHKELIIKDKNVFKNFVEQYYFATESSLFIMGKTISKTHFKLLKFDSNLSHSELELESPWPLKTKLWHYNLMYFSNNDTTLISRSSIDHWYLKHNLVTGKITYSKKNNNPTPYVSRADRLLTNDFISNEKFSSKKGMLFSCGYNSTTCSPAITHQQPNLIENNRFVEFEMERSNGLLLKISHSDLQGNKTSSRAVDLTPYVVSKERSWFKKHIKIDVFMRSYLQLTDENKYLFHLYFNNDWHYFLFSRSGKLLKHQHDITSLGINGAYRTIPSNCYFELDKKPFASYIKSMPQKDLERRPHIAISNNRGSILIEHLHKEEIKLLFFKKT